VSDLHFGRRENPAAHEALRDLAGRIRPELVIASGDLAHRGLRAQLEAATALLRSLGAPVLAVPGNHDIPYTFPARFTRPWAEFERLWETTEPVHRGERVFVVGLNSVRPWRHQSGRVTHEQLRRANRLFDEAPDGALRVAVLHHHLLGAPWRSRKKPVAKRNVVLAELVESGAELILAGHIHQSAIAERREFEIATPGGERAVVVSIAPGLGRPRPDRRGEARGLHVYEADDDSLRASTFVWRDDGWGLTAVRTFARGREPLAFEPEPSPGPLR
jgi:3',5'-cyclic AMP phosphodiesterase CpdA